MCSVIVVEGTKIVIIVVGGVVPCLALFLLLIMPPPSKRKKGAGGKAAADVVVGEVQVQKSPAEFFAENQAIAGFDNLGKSLYTSIRELVENSLDACESIGQLPHISVRITEYTQAEFNALQDKISGSPLRGRCTGMHDSALFETKKAAKRRRTSTDAGGGKSEKNESTGGSKEESTTANDAEKGDDDKDGNNNNKKKKGNPSRASQEAYFTISVRDNGCGMRHDAIPNLFGRVLSGSKYGVRQTRGKFGLGAKMALIWAKKSTGRPIRITTSHRPAGGPAGSHVSTCVLDIDIYKNTPSVKEHTKRVNTDAWIGTEVEVLIAGNWTTYKARILAYLQQLAIITPYAVLEMTYNNASEPKRDAEIRYDRRSEQMPPPAREVKYHPSSVNNLVIQHLIRRTRTKTFVKFLSTELSSVSPSLAKRLVAELGDAFDESAPPGDLSDKQITRLVQLLRRVQLFKAPDGSCLSPLGEYNLNLGIRKVLEPDLIATARDKPGVYEGHPFVVEAAVSLGGRDVKEGITVVRFANRIPLLFEGGADVSTRVAQTKIRWANYKIDHKRERVGVFVSIVSTKVPFKGTSKEYIGDDATEIQLSVKRALQSCCQQLRAHLNKRNALKDAAERKNRLSKYIPDVGRALFGILDGMRKRRAERDAASAEDDDAPAAGPSFKRARRLNETAATAMIDQLDRGQVTEAGIAKALRETVAEDGGANLTADGANDDNNGAKTSSRRRGEPVVPVPLFLVPLYNLDNSEHDVVGSLFTFRPIVPVQRRVLLTPGDQKNK